MNAILSCNELMQRLGAGAVAVDVMTPEDYITGHVAGAKNACIYEMAFLDHVAEQVSGRDIEVIVYDATGTTRSAELARERLLQAGYTNVSVLAGGFAAWRNAGLPVEADEQTVATQLELRDATYRVDTNKSRLEWIGRNLNKRHYGCIDIQAGELVITDGNLATGNLVLDMTTISNLDLQDAVWRDMLIRHLKSDDFFGVDSFPTASITVTGWKTQDVNSLKALQGSVTGDLTIRDVTRPVSFSATIAPQLDGSIQAHTAFDIDRTLWNACYGSCRLFERLGMHFVHDLISLELFVVAS